MAATGDLKERIQLLQAAKARAEALGKSLKAEAQAELDSYAQQGLLGSSAAGAAGGKVTEGERKTAFLATRMAGSLKQINDAGPDAQTPGFASLFGGTGNVVGNWLTGSGRQRVENAQLDLLDSALTLGTGAAYTKEQLQGYRQSYFPQIGDSDAAVADKKKRLDLALQAARIGAGGANPQIDEALKAAGFSVPEEQAKGGDQQSGPAGAAAVGSGAPPSDPAAPGAPPKGPIAFKDELPAEITNAATMTPEQKAAIAAVAQSGATAEQIKATYQRLGMGEGPTLEQLAPVVAFYADPKNRDKAPVVGDYDNAIKPVAIKGEGATASAVRGFADTATAGLLPRLGAVVDTVANGGTYAENLDRNRGIILNDEQQEGGARLVGQLAGGAIVPSGAAGAARAAGIAALRSGIGREAALLAANRAFAARTAVEAAGYGGAYGFNTADGSIGDRLATGAASAGMGALTGGLTAYAGGRAATALGERARGAGTTVANDGQEALQAAERQGITPFPADVGGSATRRATGAAAQTIGGVVPIRNGAQATLDSAEAVRSRVAASIGVAANPEAAGETARAGAQAFIARTGQRIGRIYDAAAAAGGRAMVDAPEARRVLDQELSPLLESPVQGPGVPILQGLRDALDQPQTVRGLREARSQIREQFENAGLRGSNLERVAGRVIDAATDDLVSGLRSQGLDRAATQYRVADRMWRERLQTIDDHLTPIIGDAEGPGMKSGEQIVAGLKSAMAGNNRRFAGFVAALPPNEQSVVRASLIQRLGMATKGQQDQGGEVFSLPTFLTNWNEIGARAKDVLFGQEGRAALNDLATYANASKQSQRFANFSNTGAAVTTSALGASLAAGPVGVITAAKVLALQYGAGRLLASPRFARWLARPPRNPNPAAARTYVARLSRIARAEPAIANDVLALQSRLADAFGSAPTRLAADEGDQRRPVADGRQGQQQPPAAELQP